MRIRLFLIAALLIAAPVAAQDDAAGTVRPGDVVRLRIWQEPDLSGDFTVHENGGVVLPKRSPPACGCARGGAGWEMIESSPSSDRARLPQGVRSMDDRVLVSLRV